MISSRSVRAVIRRQEGSGVSWIERARADVLARDLDLGWLVPAWRGLAVAAQPGEIVVDRLWQLAQCLAPRRRAEDAAGQVRHVGQAAAVICDFQVGRIACQTISPPTRSEDSASDSPSLLSHLRS